MIESRNAPNHVAQLPGEAVRPWDDLQGILQHAGGERRVDTLCVNVCHGQCNGAHAVDAFLLQLFAQHAQCVSQQRAAAAPEAWGQAIEPKDLRGFGGSYFAYVEERNTNAKKSNNNNIHTYLCPRSDVCIHGIHMLGNVCLKRSCKLWEEAGVHSIFQLGQDLHELQRIINVAARQHRNRNRFSIGDGTRRHGWASTNA